MGVFEQFPYTNFHDLNLDWLLQKYKEFATTISGLDTMISEEVAKQLSGADLEQLILNALTQYGSVINVLCRFNRRCYNILSTR